MNKNTQHTDAAWRALQERVKQAEIHADQLNEAWFLIEDIQSSLKIALGAIEDFMQEHGT